MKKTAVLWLSTFSALYGMAAPTWARKDAAFDFLEPLLKGSWDLVTRVIIRVTILITPIKVLITLLTKSHVRHVETPSLAKGPESRCCYTNLESARLLILLTIATLL